MTADGRRGRAVAEERVVLVDRQGRTVGSEEKLRAHRAGLLHRAFSIFITDARGRYLLQRRAAHKYHSGGLWSNTCCSHPRPGEDVLAAAHRRLEEEMGFNCPLTPAFAFIYRADVGGGLVEYEYDHVLLGQYSGEPIPDPAEVDGWRWVEPHTVRRELEERRGDFTPWFALVFDRVDRHASAPGGTAAPRWIPPSGPIG